MTCHNKVPTLLQLVLCHLNLIENVGYYQLFAHHRDWMKLKIALLETLTNAGVWHKKLLQPAFYLSNVLSFFFAQSWPSKTWQYQRCVQFVQSKSWKNVTSLIWFSPDKMTCWEGDIFKCVIYQLTEWWLIIKLLWLQWYLIYIWNGNFILVTPLKMLLIQMPSIKLLTH